MFVYVGDHFKTKIGDSSLSLSRGAPHYHVLAGITTRRYPLQYQLPGMGKICMEQFYHSCWNAGATIFTYHYNAFDPVKTMKLIEKYKITSLCGPLTVWKLFLLEDLKKYNFSLKKIVSAGEPLNPEISNKVKELLGLDLREGYGKPKHRMIFTPEG